MATKIEWTDETWNPVTGCSKVSAGCKHCYAEREWPRMTKLVPAYAGRDFTDVRTHADRLDQPLRWKKPRKVFVNSMSDLFHPDVPDEFIDQVFAVMTMAPRHTFQVLTKRPERMRDYMRRSPNTKALRELAPSVRGLPMHEDEAIYPWPRPNIWLGVSVEDQGAANERIPLLLDTPAAVRWISAEPLLGPVSLSGLFGLITDDEDVRIDAINGTFVTSRYQEEPTPLGARLDWVVVGGESGPKARPMHPQWARYLRDQCAAAGVPFLFKQHGEWISDEDIDNCNLRAPEIADADQYFETVDWPDGSQTYRVGKKRAGRLLDGVTHDGYPEGEKA